MKPDDVLTEELTYYRYGKKWFKAEEKEKEFTQTPAYYLMIIILSILTSVITTIVATR